MVGDRWVVLCIIVFVSGIKGVVDFKCKGRIMVEEKWCNMVVVNKY